MTKDILLVGSAKVKITPKIGITLSGYYNVRVSEGILDDLYLNAVAFKQGEKKYCVISADLAGIQAELILRFKKTITEKTGLKEEEIFICATHTHTGPEFFAKDQIDEQLASEYIKFLDEKFSEVVTLAMKDLKPATVGYGTGDAKKVAFVRRFKMKDGSTKTNPGVNNPDIIEPIGEVYEKVSVVRFDRENATTVLLVNFANHPDVVGGNYISADWPGLAREYVEKVIENTHCVFVNGAQGDVNHVNVHPVGGDLNGLHEDFDGCMRGYDHAKHIARVVAGSVMSIYDKVNYVDDTELKTSLTYLKIPANKATEEELILARKYHELHSKGLDDEIPYTKMQLTTVVAEAERMVALENAPDYFNLPFAAFSIGKIAFFGVPGEPFTGIGNGIRKAEGYDMVVVCCISNGYEGYFPMKDSYEEGGYEARSSEFKSGSAEMIIENGLTILEKLKG